MPNVYIIPGHGAGDSGATGNGYAEADMVRDLATRIGELGGGSVTLAPFWQNAYASNAISSLNLPNGTQIVELHMDSAVPSARGGHIIIKSGFSPDEYDKALAAGISSIFPGRATTIAYWSNLANANRAARRGFGYRLVECGFISNASDCETFVNRRDDIARMILGAFGIQGGNAPAQPTPQPNAEDTLGDTRYVGPKMWSELQRQLGTTVDGICSGQSEYNIQHVLVNFEDIFVGHSGGSMAVVALQKKFGVTQDGHFGHNTCKAFQGFVGAEQDGYFGPATAQAFGEALKARRFR